MRLRSFWRIRRSFRRWGRGFRRVCCCMGRPGRGRRCWLVRLRVRRVCRFSRFRGLISLRCLWVWGQSRVRDLFEQAKQASPCIVFMDEIDAVGRHRGAGLGGGNDEREQTLNQLLVEMDGFELKDNIILIAATNRPDILDPALFRPGRFDRQIVVDRPDRTGRRKILEVHSKGKPIASEIDLDTLAAGTPGSPAPTSRTSSTRRALSRHGVVRRRSDGRARRGDDAGDCGSGEADAVVV